MSAVDDLLARFEMIINTIAEPADAKLIDARRRLAVKLQSLPDLEAGLTVLRRDHAGDLARIARTLADPRFERLPHQDQMRRVRTHASESAALLESTQKMIDKIRDTVQALSAASVAAGAEGQIADCLAYAKSNLDTLQTRCPAVIRELQALDRAYRDSKEFAAIYREV